VLAIEGKARILPLRRLDRDLLVPHGGRPYSPLMTEAPRRTLLRKLENVEAFPLITLQAVRDLRGEIDGVEARAILRARELGASLEDIADAMGITRQGVAYKLKAITQAGRDDEIVDISEAEVPADPS
jgi:hypothetical protein